MLFELRRLCEYSIMTRSEIFSKKCRDGKAVQCTRLSVGTASRMPFKLSSKLSRERWSVSDENLGDRVNHDGGMTKTNVTTSTVPRTIQNLILRPAAATTGTHPRFLHRMVTLLQSAQGGIGVAIRDLFHTREPWRWKVRTYSIC